MKKNISILSTLIFVFTFHYGVANTGITTKSPDRTQEQDQEGRRKNDQTMMRPDGQLTNTSSIAEGQEESQLQENDEVKPVERTPEKADSLQDDSVSKYNFIFYFLYKFKYDTEESP
ncbi:hypothetical protein [Ekhidna sp.]|uniref:hypothetical protein n=1 Tax=Ekhidna sp. TaxID=2608089 RepID=UPI003CCC219D